MCDFWYSVLLAIGVIGEYMYLKCVAERVSHDKCKCSDDPPQYYISRDEDSDNTRKSMTQA